MLRCGKQLRIMTSNLNPDAKSGDAEDRGIGITLSSALEYMFTVTPRRQLHHYSLKPKPIQERKPHDHF